MVSSAPEWLGWLVFLGGVVHCEWFLLHRTPHLVFCDLRKLCNMFSNGGVCLSKPARRTDCVCANTEQSRLTLVSALPKVNKVNRAIKSSH